MAKWKRVEDRRFEELRRAIWEERHTETGMIAKLAIDDPGNLSGNSEYIGSRLRFTVLDNLMDITEKIDNSYKDAVEALAA